MPSRAGAGARGRRARKGSGNVRLPAPHPGQVTVREESRRFNYLFAGRRWRKSTLVMSIAVEAALQGLEIVLGAPTYSQVFNLWEETLRAAEDVASFTQSRMIAKFPSGGRMTFRSLEDPDTTRGLTAHGVVIDEIADIREEAYYDVLLPMLMDTKGWFWGIGTPKGLNWVYNEYQKAASDEESMTWRIPTLGAKIHEGELLRMPHPLENVNIDFEELQRLFTKMTEQAFRQEVLAEFVENAGSVFRNLNNTLICQRDIPELHKGHLLVQGIDWGRINDYTVISTYCCDCNREVDLERFNLISYPYQTQRVLYQYNLWRPAEILAEENTIGRVILDNLELFDLPIMAFQSTNNSKADAVQSLAVSLEKGQSFWIGEEEANQEMKGYTIKTSPTGKAIYGAPKGGHDDVVTARFLSNKLREEYGGGGDTSFSSGAFSVDEHNIMEHLIRGLGGGKYTLSEFGDIDVLGEELQMVHTPDMDRELEALFLRMEQSPDELKPFYQAELEKAMAKHGSSR